MGASSPRAPTTRPSSSGTWPRASAGTRSRATAIAVWRTCSR
ncbi:hypothetical protein CPLU01_16076 [Colletotrichum plurivorum]|uniref:Uncharacterized protein n=1 Tax=Colletotrichum plurivorum TaxID=2175906 RepID=A0A8H6J145_9PEZI|nr:hypothetical protein CPLU01_16076 [Colletotrichum plurivorum]